MDSNKRIYTAMNVLCLLIVVAVAVSCVITEIITTRAAEQVRTEFDEKKMVVLGSNQERVSMSIVPQNMVPCAWYTLDNGYCKYQISGTVEISPEPGCELEYTKLIKLWYFGQNLYGQIELACKGEVVRTIGNLHLDYEKYRISVYPTEIKIVP